MYTSRNLLQVNTSADACPQQRLSRNLTLDSELEYSDSTDATDATESLLRA